MSVATLRNSIHQLVDNVQDEHFLQSVNALLENIIRLESQSIVGYNADFQSITAKQLEQEALERVNNVKAGKFMTQEQMLEAIKNQFQ